MTTSILAFWGAAATLLIALRQWPDTAMARAAFTWLGPRPLQGESLARFHCRWAAYSFGWLCQFGFALTGLLLLDGAVPEINDAVWLKVLLFSLPLGAGMALLAFVGFLLRAAKARLLGPNPVWDGTAKDPNEN